MDLNDTVKSTVTQISTMKALREGCFDGVCNVNTLKNYGDTGIGTFEGAEGEMIMTGGIVYKALYSDEIKKAEDSETLPFALAAFYDTGTETQLSDITGMEELKRKLTENTDTDSFYMVTITGVFGKIKLRSLKKSAKPYPSLEKAAETQHIYTYTNIEGTAAGFYCPAVMGESVLNDWHLHFISSDRKHGGHILDTYIAQAAASVTRKEIFTVIHPENTAKD